MFLQLSYLYVGIKSNSIKEKLNVNGFELRVSHKISCNVVRWEGQTAKWPSACVPIPASRDCKTSGWKSSVSNYISQAKEVIDLQSNLHSALGCSLNEGLSDGPLKVETILHRFILLHKLISFWEVFWFRFAFYGCFVLSSKSDRFYVNCTLSNNDSLQ